MSFAPKAFVAIVAVAGLAFAGCGGDDDSADTSTGAGTITQRTDTSAQKQKPAQNGGDEGKGGAKSGSGDKSTSGGGSGVPSGPAPTTSSPLPNEGSKTVAPGVPLAKGGDNSIQTYGVEAPSSDRVEASRIAKAYLDARAAGSYAEACSYMSAPIKAELGSLGAQGGKASDCVNGMDAFTTGVPKAALLTAADINVLSFRVDGNSGFLLYKDGEGTPSSMPMAQESGDWKVAAIAGSALLL